MRDAAENAFVTLAAAFLRLLPLPALGALGAFAGGCARRLLGSRRRATEERIERHLPESARNGKTAAELAGEVWRNVGRSYFEFFKGPSFRADRLGASVRLADPALVSRFIDNQRPVVVATAHFGSWELLAGILGSVFADSRPRAILVRMHERGALRKLMIRQRRMCGVQVVDKANSADAARRFLQQNGVVALLGDLNTFRGEAVFLPFLGEEAAVTRGPAALAIQASALVWPVFLARTPEGKWSHTLHMDEPLDAAALSGSAEEKTRAICRYVAGTVEKMVLAYPAQWYWLHNRWKTRPPE